MLRVGREAFPDTQSLALRIGILSTEGIEETEETEKSRRQELFFAAERRGNRIWRDMHLQ